MEIIILIAMYGLTFALQHKIPAIFMKSTYKELSLTTLKNKLLSCTFCMGFHAGWICYLLSIMSEMGSFSAGDLLIFSFSGAAFSYSLDAYVQKLESAGFEDEDSKKE